MGKVMSFSDKILFFLKNYDQTHKRPFYPKLLLYNQISFIKKLNHYEKTDST
jgi:hypothetical protein